LYAQSATPWLAARLRASNFDVATGASQQAVCRTRCTSDKVVKALFSRWYYWLHGLAAKPLH
jgi:hypothetical protein